MNDKRVSSVVITARMEDKGNCVISTISGWKINFVPDSKRKNISKL